MSCNCKDKSFSSVQDFDCHKLRGPMGPQGLRGLPGPQGLSGPQGLPGATGTLNQENYLVTIDGLPEEPTVSILPTVLLTPPNTIVLTANAVVSGVNLNLNLTLVPGAPALSSAAFIYWNGTAFVTIIGSVTPPTITFDLTSIFDPLITTTIEGTVVLTKI